MDIQLLLTSLVMVLVSMWLIKWICDQFEMAADYLGKDMPSGVKGTLINGVGSSMPELLTALAFLFTITSIGASEAFLSAVAVTAGSAIYNAVVIPAVVVIIATKFRKNIVDVVTVSKPTIYRDGVFLIVAEIALIVFMGFNTLTATVGVGMLAIYAVYFFFIQYQISTGVLDMNEDDEEDDDDNEETSFLWKIVTLDFVGLLYNDDTGVETRGRSWATLGFAVLVMAGACHLLAEAVVDAATALDIPIYFTSLILAAAATSVPDTFLSGKDAYKGNDDDAVSNAIGSNIFDITVCTGLPLLLFTLVYGAIDMTGIGALAWDVQVLRIVLVGVSIAVLALFLVGRGMTFARAMVMLGIYISWVTWVAISAMGS